MSIATRAVRVMSVLAVPVLSAPFVVVSSGALSPEPAVAASPTVKAPPTKALPSGLDVQAPYQAQRICDPVAKPGVVAFATLMSTHYGMGSNGGIIRNCNSGVTEHSEGRAWDWMLNVNNAQQKATADSVVRWLVAPDAQGRPGAMARRFGINYIIWNRTMWRGYAPERGWAPYSGASAHTDHIHFSFTWDGALKQTSWWTGVPRTVVGTGPGSGGTATPAPTAPAIGYPVLREGSRGSDVTLLQRAIGASADGEFGPLTRTALVRWQQTYGVRATGIADSATWVRLIRLGKVPVRHQQAPASTTSGYAALKNTVLRPGAQGSAVRTLQTGLGGLTVDGAFGPATSAAVMAFRTSVGLSSAALADRPVWDALEVRDTRQSTYRSIVLRRGASGAPVRALQAALGIRVDGVFGPATEAAVKAVQARAGLSRNGMVGSVTWQAIDRFARR